MAVELVEGSTEQVPVSLRAIDKVLRLFGATALCLGNTIPDNDEDVIVQDSRLVCIESTDSVSTSIISNKCLLLVLNGTLACEACQYVFKLFNSNKSNHKRKRSEDNQLSIETIPSSGFEDFTERESSEMLAFDKNDSDDLRSIREKMVWVIKYLKA